MQERIRRAFGPAELIFLAGLASLAAGLWVLLPAAALVTVGVILMAVGWLWHEPAATEPAAVEPPVEEPDRDVALAELGYLRPA